MLTTKDLSSFKWLPSASLLLAKLPLKGDFPTVTSAERGSPCLQQRGHASPRGSGKERRDELTEPQVTLERGC